MLMKGADFKIQALNTCTAFRNIKGWGKKILWDGASWSHRITGDGWEDKEELCLIIPGLTSNTSGKLLG